MQSCTVALSKTLLCVCEPGTRASCIYIYIYNQPASQPATRAPGRDQGGTRAGPGRDQGGTRAGPGRDQGFFFFFFLFFFLLLLLLLSSSPLPLLFLILLSDPPALP